MMMMMHITIIMMTTTTDRLHKRADHDGDGDANDADDR